MRLEREAYGITTVEAGNADPLEALLKRIGRSALPVVTNPPPDDDDSATAFWCPPHASAQV